MQVKEVWVDVWCPVLTDTWDSTAYQRAISLDALWLTFMRMLEPSSRIKVRHIKCLSGSGRRLYIHIFTLDWSLAAHLLCYMHAQVDCSVRLLANWSSRVVCLFLV